MNLHRAVTTITQNKSDEIVEICWCTYQPDKARLIYSKLD
jgi:hypothetical protein